MDIECKKFAKDVRLLDKDMRSWDTYIQLEATVKNMLTSLRAVGELQNPAIRERHWNQLMTSTKVICDLVLHNVEPILSRKSSDSVFAQIVCKYFQISWLDNFFFLREFRTTCEARVFDIKLMIPNCNQLLLYSFSPSL